MISENLSHDSYVTPVSRYDNLPGYTYVNIEYDLYQEEEVPGRNKLNNKSPYSLFSLLYGQGVLDILRANLIIPSDICLSPGLLK